MLGAAWKPIGWPARVGFAVGAGLFLVLTARFESEGLPILDSANLVFHEAGHPVLGLVSSRLEPYGGTLFQLLIPALVAISFGKKQRPLAMAAAGIWFFENILGIAQYMADARALQLPLVGGGGHDWNHIFFQWNILSFDTRIATAFRSLGWVGMVLVSAFAVVWPWGKGHGE